MSSYYQKMVNKDTIPLTAICTPTRLFEWLVMPQGSSAAPGWFVKVINEVIKGLDLVAAYLDDVTDFDSDLSTHVVIMKKLLLRLRKHNLRSRLPKPKTAPRTRVPLVTPSRPAGSSRTPARWRP